MIRTRAAKTPADIFQASDVSNLMCLLQAKQSYGWLALYEGIRVLLTAFLQEEESHCCGETATAV